MQRFIVLTLISLLSVFCLKAQETSAVPKDEILRTAAYLYRMERARLLSTNVVLKKYPGKFYRLGGSVSFPFHDSVRTIYWLKKDSTSIELTFTFDSIPDSSNYIVDPRKRTAGEEELKLINIHQETMKIMNKNKGHFFSFYNYTSNHLVLISGETEDQVYIMTMSNDKDDLIFGNDYQLIFTKNLKLKSKLKIHENGYSLKLMQDTLKDSSDIETFHTHKESTLAYITATDICVLMLYSDKVNWVKHTVLSDSYACTWNLKKQDLLILTRKSYDKILEKKLKAKRKKIKPDE